MSKPSNSHPEPHAQPEYLGGFQITELSAHNNKYIKDFKNCSRALFHLGLDIRGGQAFLGCSSSTCFVKHVKTSY